MLNFKFFYDTLLNLITLILGVYLIVKYIKLNKDKNDKEKKYSIISFIFFIALIILCNINVVDKVPVKFNSLEKAFKYDYDDSYNLIFKEKYKNTCFVVAKATKKADGVINKFNCYKKIENKWMRLGNNSTKYKKCGSYDVYYFNNKEDKITAIFIGSFFNEDADKIKISDEYKTKFEKIKDNNNKIIKYAEDDLNSSSVYLGIIKKNIKEKYYISINNKKCYIK